MRKPSDERDGVERPSATQRPARGDGGFERRWRLHLRDTATLEDFEVGRTIGVGAFGRVLYARGRRNGRPFAMKAMKKEKLVRLEQVRRVLNEKRVLQSVVHPFLVNLRFVLKTNSYLFLVMPLVGGGELLSYMRAFKTFDERQTKFFSGQVILALQYLHRVGIVYRDLKPENVLVECDGYLKITDFGFAKRIASTPSGRHRRAATSAATMSFVGTPEYMAPEMLVRTRRARGYGFSVDWWAVGVFVYECVAGAPPFAGTSLLQLFDRVVRGSYDQPPHFGDQLVDLTRRLLEPNERRRLGCGAAGADELKTHPWYADLNWAALLERQLPPEFVPKCDAANPTANFQHFPEEPMQQAARPEFADEFRYF